MAICEKCGKEFEAKGDWQKVCIDCYKAQASDAKKAHTKKTETTASVPKAQDITAEMLRQAYDEVLAAFADVREDVVQYVGGWTTTIALSKAKVKK